MLDVDARSAAINLAYLCLALLVAWFVLLWLDRRLARGKGRSPSISAACRTMLWLSLSIWPALPRHLLAGRRLSSGLSRPRLANRSR
jgi:hypothetical protein